MSPWGATATPFMLKYIDFFRYIEDIEEIEDIEDIEDIEIEDIEVIEDIEDIEMASETSWEDPLGSLWAQFLEVFWRSWAALL